MSQFPLYFLLPPDKLLWSFSDSCVSFCPFASFPPLVIDLYFVLCTLFSFKLSYYMQLWVKEKQGIRTEWMIFALLAQYTDLRLSLHTNKNQTGGLWQFLHLNCVYEHVTDMPSWKSNYVMATSNTTHKSINSKENR